MGDGVPVPLHKKRTSDNQDLKDKRRSLVCHQCESSFEENQIPLVPIIIGTIPSRNKRGTGFTKGGIPIYRDGNP